MADNVAITPGVGASVSTEEVTTLNGGAVSARHVQRVGAAFITGDGQAVDAATGAGNVGSNVQRVTLCDDGPLVTAIGAKADTSATSDTGTFSLIALFKRALGYLSTIATGAASVATSNVNLGTQAISLSDGTQLTPKFAKIAASSSGAATVVAAVTSKKIRVLQFYLTGNGAVNANFQSHTTTATATGLVYIAAAGGGVSVPFSPLGSFETVAGEALDINLSGAVAVGGHLVYVEV